MRCVLSLSRCRRPIELIHTNDTFQLSHISFDFVQQLLAHCTSDHLAIVYSFFSLMVSPCHRQRYRILSFDHWQIPLVVSKTVRKKTKKSVKYIFCDKISGNRDLCAMFSAFFTIIQLPESNFKAHHFLDVWLCTFLSY